MRRWNVVAIFHDGGHESRYGKQAGDDLWWLLDDATREPIVATDEPGWIPWAVDEEP